MSNNIIIAPNNFDDGADGVVFISGLAVATESDNEDDCLVLDADDFEWPKATGKLEVPPSWNVSQELLDKLEAERKGGLTITPDGSENLEIVNVWPNLEAEQGETE